MFEVLGSIWWLIVALGVLVTFHEYGHFWVARRCGVKVLQVFRGLWPRAVVTYRRRRHRIPGGRDPAGRLRQNAG